MKQFSIFEVLLDYNFSKVIRNVRDLTKELIKQPISADTCKNALLWSFRVMAYSSNYNEDNWDSKFEVYNYFKGKSADGVLFLVPVVKDPQVNQVQYIKDLFEGLHYYVCEKNKDDNNYKPALTLPEGTDPATAKLIASSIPKYRNSDKCPTCGRPGQFIRFDLVCAQHGPFYPG